MSAAEATFNRSLSLIKEDEYKDYFATPITGIFHLDRQLRIKNLNQEAERICGVERAEVIGKQAETVFQRFGEPFRRVLSPSESEDIYSANMTLNVNEQLVYVHVDTLKLIDSFGLGGMIIIMQDLSSVRAAIKQIQTTKMLMSLGELAAGVAHHVRTPLTIISGYLQVMLGRLENDKYTVRRDVLEVLLDEVSYINDVVKELVMFAKPPVTKEPDIEVNRVLEEALMLVFKELGGEKIEIEKKLAAGLPSIVADANLLKQAFVNIVQNAMEAMPEEGKLTIKSWLNAELNMLVVAIADTGSGVAPEILSQVFEPFYTTKLDRMGLGLPIAHRIITEHGGFIHINPKDGGGTRVHVYLPIFDDSIRNLTVVQQQMLNLQ